MDEALTERKRDRAGLDPMTEITVFRNKFAKGWPRHLEAEHRDRGYIVELGQALERDYTSDAHFAAYRTQNGRRLTGECLDHGVSVALTAIVFDVDGAGHTATPDWRRVEREKVIALNSDHPGVYFYETRGGYRIVYRQPAPTVLRSSADARNWSRDYAVLVAYMSRVYGIVADLQCKDWTRLYRLPRATRDAGGKPENWPYWGSSERIGALRIEATDEDVDTACPPPPQRQITVGSVRSSGTSADEKLREKVEAVRTAAEGQRNRELNRSAYALAGLVRDGQLAENDVYRELFAAARSAGLGEREIASTLASGLGAGLRGAA